MSESVLVVEDDSLEAVLFREAFRACGVAGSIAVANTGDAALSYLDTRGRLDPPAFIMIDLETPGGGFDLLRRLRERQDAQEIPTVMVSSTEDDEALALAQEMGADAFLVRPKAEKDLQAAFSLLAQRWLGPNPGSA